MPTTNLNIRMDSKLKENFEHFCDDMGMTMTTAITIFAKQAIRENRIPFEIRGEIPNKETIAAINEVQQMKKDPSIGKSYNDINELFEDALR
jgi:DNA-damage-inducible protein J